MQRKETILSQKLTNENAFKIILVDDSEKNDIFFVKSTFSVLLKFIKMLKIGDKSILKPKLLKKVDATLSSLIFFVIKTNSKNPIECEGKNIILFKNKHFIIN